MSAFAFHFGVKHMIFHVSFSTPSLTFQMQVYTSTTRGQYSLSLLKTSAVKTGHLVVEATAVIKLYVAINCSSKDKPITRNILKAEIIHKVEGKYNC